MNKEKIFRKNIEDLIKRAHSLEREEVLRVMDILDDARKEVAAQVASTPWDAHHLAELKAAIDRAITNFGNTYAGALSDGQVRFMQAGIDLVDVPLRGVGVFAAIPEIDTTAFSIMQGYSADLVKGLTEDMKKRINSELTLTFLGGKSPFEAMKEIGRTVGAEGTIFGGISRRAETITRTEGNRILNAASEARNRNAARVVPGLQKQWKHSRIGIKEPREDHLEADGIVVPVDEPFIIGGKEYRYPLDPARDAADTINCH